MSIYTKWTCQLCTYSNWSQSRKCCVCHTAKPSISGQLNLDETQQTNFQTEPEPGGQNILQTNQKWICPACTYANWPNSLNCVQCRTRKQTNTSVVTRSNSNLVEQSKTTNISNEITNSLISHAINIKWICHFCTYSNWPKSEVCVMCQQKRLANAYQNENLPDSEGSCDQLPVSAQPLLSSAECPLNGGGGGNNVNLNLSSSDSTDSVSHVVSSNPSLNSTSGSKTRQLRSLLTAGNELDFLWISAVSGVIENNRSLVEAYLRDARSQLTRKITRSESRLLYMCGIKTKFPSDLIGFNLIKLAQKSGNLSLLLDIPSARWLCLGSLAGARKKMPCQVGGEVARNLRHYFLVTLHPGAAHLNCLFMRDCCAFSLPADLFSRLPPRFRNIVLAHCMDTHAQHELEYEEQIINWWCDKAQLFSLVNGPQQTNLSTSSSTGLAGSAGELDATHQQHQHRQQKSVNRVNSCPYSNYLFALWNRSAGDCLLDSVMQAVFGVLDKDNTLRSVLANCMVDASAKFFERWREHENQLAQRLGYVLHDSQLRRHWTGLLEMARRPGESLEQGHIFVLAHIFRRPIVVYGVKYIHNQRDEPVGYANYQGVYLPLLWETQLTSTGTSTSTSSSSSSSTASPMSAESMDRVGGDETAVLPRQRPIVLGYTRGHFSALVLADCSGNTPAFNPVHQVAASVSNRLLATPPLPARHAALDSVGRDLKQLRLEDELVGQSLLSSSSSSSSSAGEDQPTPLALDNNDDEAEEDTTLGNQCPQYESYLPLFDQHGELLPVHFLSSPGSLTIGSGSGHQRHSTSTTTTTTLGRCHEWSVLRRHFDLCQSRHGLPLFRLRWGGSTAAGQNPLVCQLTAQWMDAYRERLCQRATPSPPSHHSASGAAGEPLLDELLQPQSTADNQAGGRI